MLVYIQVMKMMQWKDTSYEDLQTEADNSGLNTKEKNLQFCDGLIIDNNVAIRKSLLTSVHKKCTLAEEMGHSQTAAGDLLDQRNVTNQKLEKRGRIWGYNRLIGLWGIVAAYQRGCSNRYEMAEYLGVTEEFLNDALKSYAAKYGVYARTGNYLIVFEPNLSVIELKS